MEYRRVRFWTASLLWLFASLIFVFFSLIVTSGIGIIGSAFAVGIIFLIVFIVRRQIFVYIDTRQHKHKLETGITRLISEFTVKVRTCFTTPEFVSAIRENLEQACDASVLLIQSNTWDILYSSPATLTSDPILVSTLKKRFRELSEGFVFIDENYELLRTKNNCRGFFVFGKGYYFFVFSRVCQYVDMDAYRILYSELLTFFDRLLTVAKLFDIASLTKEWHQIAKTQKSFLPEMLPEQPKLSLAAYWRPLVNVSGDFYDAIRIDDEKTLIVMGDVSGKGLGAALVMGIAVNTISAARDKTNLPELMRTVDNAIRTMGFDDKYTVMFLGLLDTGKKTFKYINAALPEQFLVVQTVKGPVVKRLGSNCGIVGLVPLDSIEVEELELRTGDIIILTTDGLTEIVNDKGLPFDQSPEFQKLMAEAINISSDELVSRLATLGETYVDKKLRDDITILAVKVGRLWD